MIQPGLWNYGYFHDTTYTIFGREGQLCHLMLVDGAPAFIVGERVVLVSDLQGVCVRLMKENTEYEMFLRSAQGDVPVLRAAVDLNAEEDEDISLLVGTDWAVRAAGGAVLAARRAGGKARLLLPRVLLPEVIASLGDQRGLRWSACVYVYGNSPMPAKLAAQCIGSPPPAGVAGETQGCGHSSDGVGSLIRKTI